MHFIWLLASSYIADFNARNKLLTQKLLNKAIDIINFAKHFLNFTGPLKKLFHYTIFQKFLHSFIIH